MVGTWVCGGMAHLQRRDALWVASRTGVGPWEDRFATPGTGIVIGRGGGARKRLGRTGIVSQRGTGGAGRSHSARAPLTLRRSAPRARHTLTPMTFTWGGEVARGVHMRGSRWASGLIRGGEIFCSRDRFRQANAPPSLPLLHLHLLVSIHHILAIHRTVPGTTALSTRAGGAGMASGVVHGTTRAKDRAREKW